MHKDRYDIVPAVLPEQLPAMTRVEAQRIATKITRKFWPRTRADYKFPASAVRRVWLSSVPTSATNHDKGLGRLIHDLSHQVFRAVYPRKLPHDPLHVRYETDIAEFVAGSAWLSRVMAPKKSRPKPGLAEKRALALARVEQAIGRWESKQRRAKTALTKLGVKRRRLVKLLSQP